MNIKKVEKQIRKINQLLENIKDEGQVTMIERDLMLSYVRSLYERVMDSDDNDISKSTKSRRAVESTPAKAPYVAPTPEPTPAAVNIADVVREEIAGPTPEQIAASRAEEIKYRSAPIIAEPAPAVQEVEPEVAVATAPDAPEELLALFEAEGDNNDLSDKLSRSPIADLTKCMSINEKVFTIKELFGGDSGLFSATMQSLDGMTSLEQARDYLVTNIALEQDWSGTGKIKKAAQFVKLISRRY